MSKTHAIKTNIDYLNEINDKNSAKDKNEGIISTSFQVNIKDIATVKMTVSQFIS